jgi:hypothetical protein
LLAQSIIDEVGALGDMARSFHLGMRIGAGEIVSESKLIEWFKARLEEASRIAQDLTRFASEAMNKALVEINVPDLMFSGREVGRMYRESMEWGLRIRRVHVPERWQPLAAEMSRLTEGFVSQLEAMGPALVEQIRIAADAPGDKKIMLEYKLVISPANMDKLNAELARLSPK